jgi:hypothetical protein
VTRLRKNESVASVAETIFTRLDKTGEGRERSRAIAAWRQVAGAEVFSHARGFALRDGELLVFVDSSTWANELSVLSEHYRTAVNERLGKEAVGSMRFAVSKKVAQETGFEREDEAAEAESRRDRVPPVPLTANEREQLSLMAAAVKSEKLRETVVAAATAHLEWRKGIEAHNAAQKAVQSATEGSKPPQA